MKEGGASHLPLLSRCQYRSHFECVPNQQLSRQSEVIMEFKVYFEI